MRKLLLTATLLVLHIPLLSAHPMNVAYVDIAVGRGEIRLLLSVNLFELDLFLSLDRNLNAEVEQEELDAKSPEILEYLQQKIRVFVGHKQLPLEADPFRIGQAADGKPIVKASFLFRSSQPVDAFSIYCAPLTELGPDHKTIAKISRQGKIEQFVFQEGVAYEGKGRGFAAYTLQFLQLGVLHIFTGYDHILFLVGLLLMGGGWLTIIKIVTSFTLAHSITLSLAALDVVNLPSRLVESGIALSIIYIALENLFFEKFDRRWMVSFFFGLVHGFGFAGVLKEMDLPRSGLVSSLFSFNAGVEVGQVIIVLIILPVLRSLSHIGSRKMVVTSGSVLILSFGLFWFYQRAF
ncbi:MAG: HupE/UreJ family protein [Candidatus Methylomirabilales bacterium]